MLLESFGLTHDPLGKLQKEYIDTQQYEKFNQRCDWLLQTRGIALLTGESGTGKTAAVRRWVDSLNPHQYLIHYQGDNHFQPFDIYAQLAESFGLEKQHRYSLMWRSIKKQLHHLYHEKSVTTLWVLDEAQSLPYDFITGLPSFLNSNRDTEDLIIILLVGTPKFHTLLGRASLAPLSSRLQFHYDWQPLKALADFSALVKTAFEKAGRADTFISDSGMQTLHLASKGRLRTTHRIITRAMQMAIKNQQNHLTDSIIEQAIDELRSITL